MTRTLFLHILDRYYALLLSPVYKTNDRLVYVREQMIPKMACMVEAGDTASFEKANRWLGFAQGVLWSEGVYTIDAMREHNRNGKFER